MQLPQDSFNELRLRLKESRLLDHAGSDPVFYMVFSPSQMPEVKRLTKTWTAKLKLEGWSVEQFSMADAVEEIFLNHPLRDIWLEAEAESPLAFEEINQTLSDALLEGNALQSKLASKLDKLKDRKTTLLFVTDVEALHPYLRVGSLEQRLQGRFSVPTIIFYPGVRTGRTNLKFLGIYPEDGNYRSTHIG